MPFPNRLYAKTARRLFAEAVAAHRAGDRAGAEKRLNRLRAAFPDHADVCHLLGVVRLAAKRPADAVAPLQAALELAGRGRPDILPGVLNALGSALRLVGRASEAVEAFGRAARLAPDDGDVLYNLGGALWESRRFADAAAALRAAARLKPADPDVLFAFGQAASAAGDFDSALAAFGRVLAADPSHAKTHASIAHVHMERGDLQSARAALDSALRHDPGVFLVQSVRGKLELLLGNAAHAIAADRAAMALDPADADMHGALIQHMAYAAEYSAADILAEARAWNARHARPLAALTKPHANARDPGKRLKIGYIGGDFCAHPVGAFLGAFLGHHDPAAVETFAYMTSLDTDWMTDALRARTHHWRDAAMIADDELIRAIRADGIDILVDVAGHTAHNRLSAFAQRPAPVQATGFGVTGTTGLEAMDYIIADRFEVPPGYERFYSESVVRLPHDNVCYAHVSLLPSDPTPEVGPLPARAQGAVTFGCFNMAGKIAPQAVALWARVLKAVPGSRMFLKNTGLGHDECRARFTGLFSEQGIGPGRLILEGPALHAELLAAYGRVDIALDPLPYSGGLTTFESLWMGVPVVTLPGETFASRHSTSHVANAGFPELIARDAEDYVAIAQRLAGDLDALAALRSRLRPRMAASPVCDGAAYARGLEAAYRTMWRRWVAGEKPTHLDIPPPAE